MCLILLTCAQAYSQWQPDVRLTNEPSASRTSDNNAWCIAASGDSVHVVWYDFRNGTENIYYKRSTNSGISWGDDFLLVADDYSYNPSIAVSGMVVHVVWTQTVGVNDEIYYRRSPDGGNSWEPVISIRTGGTSDNPSMAVSGSVVNIVWAEDIGNNNDEIYVNYSTTGGVSWSSAMRLTNDPANANNPTVSVSGLIVNVFWEDNRDGGGFDSELYFKRSTTGGASWGTDMRLTNATGFSWYPSASVFGSTVHLVWEDRRNGNNNPDIFYKRSTDGGVTWDQDTRITTSLNAGRPSISVSGSIVHVVWEDTPNFDFDIYNRFSTNGGINWQNVTQLTIDPAWQRYPSVSVSDSVVHAVWQDSRHGGSNTEIYYKRNPNNSAIFYTCSGEVTYKDNNQPVTSGFAKALRYDRSTANIVTVDSTAILQDGSYTFSNMPRGDTLYLMYYQIGDTLDFVPGFYVSTIDWRQATKIIPLQNLNNTNGQVDRINNQASLYSISGLTQQNGSFNASLIPLKDAIVYVLVDTTYKNYGISNSNGIYTATKLAPGNYTLVAHRIGFSPVTQNVTITNSNLQNINFDFGSPTGINNLGLENPKEFSLNQNYPNPFNPSTTIKYQIPELSYITLKVYDVLGNEIATLVNEEKTTGGYEVRFDSKGLSSGVYFYKLTGGNYSETKKMLLLR
jgi:hypothetical protein